MDFKRRPGDEFVVKLARSDGWFVVPVDKSVLHVLRENGVMSHRLAKGVCGACETAVISGHPDHRDSILTDAEREAGKSIMIFYSGSRTDCLMLDL